MLVMDDVRSSLDPTNEIIDLLRTSEVKSHIVLRTDSGPLEFVFEGFASEYMAIGKTREGLHVAILLAKDEASHDTCRSTIILSKQRTNA